MEAWRSLIEVLQEARILLAIPSNNFFWSSWEDTETAITEIDGLISEIKSGSLPDRLKMSVLFAPTGPIQEVSLSSGWAQEFLDLAARFDEAARLVYE